MTFFCFFLQTSNWTQLLLIYLPHVSLWIIPLSRIFLSPDSNWLFSCWFHSLNLPQQLLLLWSRPLSFLFWIIVIVYLSESLPLILLPPFNLCAICCQIHLRPKNRSYNVPTVLGIDFNFLVRHKWTVTIWFVPISASSQVFFVCA